MDTRIVALLLLISVAGSSAERRSPLFRTRRGLQESDRSSVMDFAGVLRMKRQSGDLNTSKGTAVSTSTSNPNTATSPNKNPESMSTGKEDPVTDSTRNSNRPTTTSTSDLSSMTSDTFKQSPTTTTASTTISTTESKLESARPTSAITTSDPPNRSTTSRSKSTRSNFSTTPPTSPSEATAVSTTEKSSDSGEATSVTTTTVAPGIGSRIDAEEETQKPNEKIEPESYANQGLNVANPINPGFPNFAFPPYFFPNFLPEFSYPSSPNSESTLNSIPSTGDNSVWVGPSNGGGLATSFASASASAGASDNSNYNTSPLVYRGGFPDQLNTDVASTAAIKPNMPNMVNTGGYGYGGDTTYYPGPVVFPGYDFANFQREMEKLIRDFQLQSQQQQQALFGANNRIGVAGGSTAPGPHSAFSSINLGPGGGYQAGAINPAAPGLESRFGEEIPPPSGNSFGVFSSSSSHSLVGPDGKTISHKSSTTGVNDNGKITFRTVQD